MPNSEHALHDELESAPTDLDTPCMWNGKLQYGSFFELPLCHGPAMASRLWRVPSPLSPHADGHTYTESWIYCTYTCITGFQNAFSGQLHAGSS